jgi:putative ABC transport system permease protein
MNSVILLKNYLTIAGRKWLKRKSYVMMNVTGLAVGMVSSFLILLFIEDELGYDRHHQNAENIYRLVTVNTTSSGSGFTLTPTTYAGRLIDDLPNVIAGTRVKPSGGLVAYQGKRFNEDRFFFADSTFFQVFTFRFKKGNPLKALALPHSVAITAAMAIKYFGDEDPIDRVLTLDDTLHFKVTGVLDEVPLNSHFKFDFLASIVTVERSFYSVLTYLLLDKNASPRECEKALPVLFKKYAPDYVFMEELQNRLQPLTDIHFHSHLQWEIEPNGEIVYIYIFSMVAAFVLLLACINFINLATAQAAHRAREVGMRKVVGADRRQLFLQFIGESLIIAMLAFGLALVLVECALPWFNTLVNKQLVLRYSDHLLPLLGITVLAGIFSGSYPALYLSRFEPAQVLHGKFGAGRGGHALRRALVVAQFTIAIVLISGTAIVHNQLEFFRNRNLGFSKEQVVVVIVRDKEVQRKHQIFKNDLMQHPNVIKAAASSTVPGRAMEASLPQIMYSLPGVESESSTDEMMVNTFFVDYDFVEAMEVQLTAGRNFLRTYPTDVTDALILNESAMRRFGWSSPNQALGRELEYWQKGFQPAVVIGVARDFHYASLHNSTDPLIIRLLDPNEPVYPILVQAPGVISVRIRSHDIPDTLEFMRSKWKEIDPYHPFEYFFLDEYIDQLYRAEQRLARIFGYFSLLAVFIACLGMFGLASFTAEQRTREIGMRKVLGATAPQILLLLSMDFAKLVVAAFALALPFAYFAMSKWLQSFAYRVEIGSWTFALVGCAALLIALLTVGYHVIKVAHTNPVNVLQYE